VPVERVEQDLLAEEAIEVPAAAPEEPPSTDALARQQLRDGLELAFRVAREEVDTFEAEAARQAEDPAAWESIGLLLPTRQQQQQLLCVHPANEGAFAALTARH
jgi:hypothetical protein